ESVSNSFYRVRLEKKSCSAADYLAWSDQFEPELAHLREALKRPFAQPGLDYQQPFSKSYLNFISVRGLVQMLSQRVQCHLLLNQPDAALRDLTLMHEMRRCLAIRPASVISAMIDVAVVGLYVTTFND